MEILLKLDNLGGDCTSVHTRLEAGVMLDRIFYIFSTKYDEKCWQASGVLGTISFFPLLSRKLTVLKAFLESQLLLLNFLEKNEDLLFRSSRTYRLR